jgi:GNAT superfamily N-acetyltransferase
MKPDNSELIQSIYNVIIEMHENTQYSKFTTNEDKIKDMIIARLDNGFIYYDGMCLLIGSVFTQWFCDDVFAADTLLYTKKEHRGKGLAKIAAKTFIQWAQENGATQISFGQSTGVNEKEFNRMADSLGLNKVGAVYYV